MCTGAKDNEVSRGQGARGMMSHSHVRHDVTFTCVVCPLPIMHTGHSIFFTNKEVVHGRRTLSWPILLRTRYTSHGVRRGV